MSKSLFQPQGIHSAPVRQRLPELLKETLGLNDGQVVMNRVPDPLALQLAVTRVQQQDFFYGELGPADFVAEVLYVREEVLAPDARAHRVSFGFEAGEDVVELVERGEGAGCGAACGHDCLKSSRISGGFWRSWCAEALRVWEEGGGSCLEGK